MRPRCHRRHLLVLSLAAALAGCASSPPQATVQVFTSQPQLASGATYRFERLPSQSVQPGQAELEAAADALLGRAGLRRDDASPRLSVLLTSTQSLANAGYGPGWGGSSVGIGIGGGGGHSGVGIGLGFPLGSGGVVQSSNRVDVVLRDLASGQVLFQSQASGPPGISAITLLQATLRDFPNVPPGARQVPLASATAR